MGRRVLLIASVVGFCLANWVVHAEPSSSCKQCRDQQRACMSNYSAKTCNSEYQICMKGCRK
jgi:hypothetical protein